MPHKQSTEVKNPGTKHKKRSKLKMSRQKLMGFLDNTPYLS